MTKKLQNQTLDEGKSRKRILKPVVEKKRRDRINQSLADLRHLLLNCTSDARLQNPKIEKAEILDLAVEYLQKWTEGKNLSSEFSAPPLFSIENAGFQQCVTQMTSYIHKVTPAQRERLIERLKHHTESQQTKPDFNQRITEMPDAAFADAICTFDTKEDSPRLLFPSHSPFQPHSCSTPCHDYLSPPPSPWFSPSFSTYPTSSPFPSFACHFSFPPSMSPPSSNTSFFSLSPTLPLCSPPGLPIPQLTTLRPPLHPAHREESAPNSSSAVWRPWF
ncbi:transcription factor HES-7-like [Embiotoca jacksoni]|uniref:transcription factor HES-7-like n=1 Tax=Embiotoca jacksoni TaxID=100190 RepID=UPI003703EB35